MNILKLSAVIFDVDGTLIDSVDLHASAWQQALRRFGKYFPFDEVRNLIGKGGDELMSTLLSKQDIANFGEQLKEYRSQLYREHYLDHVKPFPDVRDLVELIRNENVQIAIGSSAQKAELNYYLDLLDIMDLVGVKTSADDVEKAKPHPDIFEVVLKRARVDAGDCVVIGDSPFDAEAATKAGLRTTGFLSGGFTEEKLTKAGACGIYNGPSDLLRHLRQRKSEKAA